MGGQSKQATASEQASANLANTEASLASQVGGISLPAFQQAINMYSAILSGDASKIQPFVAPQAEATNAAYSQAAKNITAGTQRGGEQSAALASNQTAQAGSLSEILPQLMQSALQTLTSAGLSGSGTSLSGTQGAAGIYSTNAQTQQSGANAKANMIGGIAQGAGSAAGGAMA